MIVLDAAVLVYATGEEHRFREPCAALLTAVAAGRIAGTTTVEVVQEFAHVRSRRRPRSDAVALAQAYADLLSPLLLTTESDLRCGLGLYDRHPGLGAFDALLAACAIANGATAPVSGDRGFGAIEGLKLVVPDEAGVASLQRS